MTKCITHNETVIKGIITFQSNLFCDHDDKMSLTCPRYLRVFLFD